MVTNCLTLGSEFSNIDTEVVPKFRSPNRPIVPVVKLAHLFPRLFPRLRHVGKVEGLTSFRQRGPRIPQAWIVFALRRLAQLPGLDASPWANLQASSRGLRNPESVRAWA